MDCVGAEGAPGGGELGFQLSRQGDQGACQASRVKARLASKIFGVLCRSRAGALPLPAPERILIERACWRKSAIFFLLRNSFWDYNRDTVDEINAKVVICRRAVLGM